MIEFNKKKYWNNIPVYVFQTLITLTLSLNVLLSTMILLLWNKSGKWEFYFCVFIYDNCSAVGGVVFNILLGTPSPPTAQPSLQTTGYWTGDCIRKFSCLRWCWWCNWFAVLLFIRINWTVCKVVYRTDLVPVGKVYWTGVILYPCAGLYQNFQCPANFLF